MTFDFLSDSPEETLRIVYRDNWVLGFVEGVLKRSVSCVRHWNEFGRQTMTKELCVQLLQMSESVVDQILQVTAAHPDWDDEAVWKAVQWGPIERELREYASEIYDSEQDRAAASLAIRTSAPGRQYRRTGIGES